MRILFSLEWSGGREGRELKIDMCALFNQRNHYFSKLFTIFVSRYVKSNKILHTLKVSVKSCETVKRKNKCRCQCVWGLGNFSLFWFMLQILVLILVKIPVCIFSSVCKMGAGLFLPPFPFLSVRKYTV